MWMDHERPTFHMWTMCKMYIAAVWHGLKIKSAFKLYFSFFSSSDIRLPLLPSRSFSRLQAWNIHQLHLQGAFWVQPEQQRFTPLPPLHHGTKGGGHLSELQDDPESGSAAAGHLRPQTVPDSAHQQARWGERRASAFCSFYSHSSLQLSFYALFIPHKFIWRVKNSFLDGFWIQMSSPSFYPRDPKCPANADDSGHDWMDECF